MAAAFNPIRVLGLFRGTRNRRVDHALRKKRNLQRGGVLTKTKTIFIIFILRYFANH